MILKKIIYIVFFFFVGVFPTVIMGQNNYAGTKEFKLSPPNVLVDSLLFIEKATIKVLDGVSESKVFYQIGDEKKPFSASLVLTQSTEISIWAEHEAFQKSDVQDIKVVKISNALSNAEITITPNPNDSYSGNGPKTLIDLQKGSTSFRGNKKWLGFQENIIAIKLKTEQAISVSKLQIGVLNDQGSWIFMPHSVEVFSNEELIGMIDNAHSVEENPSISTFLTVPIKNGPYDELLIKIKPLKSIPDWHPGKGTPAWVFIDEILIEP